MPPKLNTILRFVCSIEKSRAVFGREGLKKRQCRESTKEKVTNGFVQSAVLSITGTNSPHINSSSNWSTRGDVKIAPERLRKDPAKLER